MMQCQQTNKKTRPFVTFLFYLNENNKTVSFSHNLRETYSLCRCPCRVDTYIYHIHKFTIDIRRFFFFFPTPIILIILIIILSAEVGQTW